MASSSSSSSSAAVDDAGALFFFSFVHLRMNLMTSLCWKVFDFLCPCCIRNGLDDGPSPTLQVMDMASTAVAAADDADIPPPPPREKYDVFISFRGEDTRFTFTSYLHAALLRKKIETYIDYRLKKGGEIGPALVEAVNKSTLSVIIFSQNYASSTWCLDELAHILECEQKYGHVVIPIFYYINPSDVRKQQGSYAVAFAQLEQRFKDSINKVNKWRTALTTAANLAGFDNSNKTRPEADLVEEVVEDILTKLSLHSSSDLNGLVGIESRIQRIESLLCINDSQLDVCTVGIWGMGGIGKTTLAEAVFHGISSNFEACCLLKNVREISEKAEGQDILQKKLLTDILNEENLSIGSTFVRHRLSRSKVLIVFNDVSDSRQIEHLAGDHGRYGFGSRIMITTRDRSLLREINVPDDKIYKVKGLKHAHALRLFNLHAFKDNYPRTDYTELSAMVVDYAGGTPLALKIMGSSFLHCKSKDEWEDELNKLKVFPSEKIHKVLRLSYDVLEKNEKQIFLEIACFYKDRKKDDVRKMLGIRGFSAVSGIRILIDMSLISVSTRDLIEMHDLVHEMGRTIVKEQCVEEPGKRTRLFAPDDVCHVLKNNTGTDAVEAIQFDISKIRELHLRRAAFKKMHNLRVLKISKSEFDENGCKFYLPQGVLSLPKALKYFCWEECPFQSLPSKNFTENLVELHFPHSQLEQLFWNKDQPLVNLKVINLRFCNRLTEVPDLSRSLKIEHINLNGCTTLAQIPLYFQSLENLTHLNLNSCSNLKYLPEMPDNIEVLCLSETAIKELPSSVWCMKKLGTLDVTYCQSLQKLPSNSCKLNLTGTFSLYDCSSLSKFWELPKDITELNLSCTSIEELPSSIGCLFGLTSINLNACKMLVSLPTSICKLKYLEELYLSGCFRLEYFPEILEPMERLKVLRLRGTSIKEIPSSIDRLSGLSEIGLENCERLVSVPSSIFKLKSFTNLDLSGCSEFEYFPEILEPIEHMLYLDLSDTSVKKLPSSIEYLSGLREINLRDCKRLVSLPTSICKLKSLERLSLRCCYRFECFPEILESMKHMKQLHLGSTAVKELPSSIENLIGLQELDLRECENLEVVPSSIYNLNCLQSLNLDGCWKLPPPPSVGLCSLKQLSVRYSSPLLIIFVPSLLEIDLTGSSIESIPASIKQASQLTHLRLNNCTDLQALPELPLKLTSLEAHGLHSLKTVSSSMPALTQDLDHWDYKSDQFVYTNCLKLDQIARNNIMTDAHQRIMGMAFSDKNTAVDKSSIIIACSGEEIPNWFSYQSEGSSISINLPPDWFNTDFLGFALSLVVEFNNCDIEYCGFDCEFIFKTSNGESQEFSIILYGHHLEQSFYDECGNKICDRFYDRNLNSDHVFVWYETSFHHQLSLAKGIYNGVIEASYSTKKEMTYSTKLGDKMKLKKCGIHLLYAPKC